MIRDRGPDFTAVFDAVLDRTLIWNQNHLRQILRQYETHHD